MYGKVRGLLMNFNIPIFANSISIILVIELKEIYVVRVFLILAKPMSISLPVLPKILHCTHK